MKKNQKKKVCFFISGAYPLFNPEAKDILKNGSFGGAEVDLYNIARSLAKNEKYTVQFAVGDYGQSDIEYYDNIKVIKLKYLTAEEHQSKLHQKILRKLMMIWQLIKIDSDVFITKTAWEMLGWLAIVEKLIMRRKLVFKLSSDVNTDLDFYRKDKRLYALYKFGIYHTNRIICQSEQQRKMLSERLGLDGCVIKNAFLFDEAPDFTEKRYILWVSRGIKIKRAELFLELARRVPEQNFVIVIVPEDAGIFNAASGMAARLPNVRLIDFVPFACIQKYYEEARLFVNTSEFEGFPNSFIQACIAKTPILSFRVNPDDMIKKYDLGCLCEDDMDSAVEFIKGLDEKTMRYYGENAFKYASENHDMRVVIKEYEEIIDSL